MSIITAQITSGNMTYTFDETQIIINPTISKSICSGGYSAGNTACACLKIGVPSKIYNKGDLVTVNIGAAKVTCNFYIDSWEKCGWAKINPTDTYPTEMFMLTCYDAMYKLDNYYTFSNDTNINGIVSAIQEVAGISFDVVPAINNDVISKDTANGKKLREWLGEIASYFGGNYQIKSINGTETISLIHIWDSGATVNPVANSSLSFEPSISITQVAMSGKDGKYTSGNTDGETLEMSCSFCTQLQTDLIISGIVSSGNQYQSFKCEKSKIQNCVVNLLDLFNPIGKSETYKIYSYDIAITINGLYLTCGADVFKKKINDEPQIKKSDELKAITEFAVTFENGIATFTWKNPTSNFTGAILKRKATTDFNNIFEGETIYTGNAETFADTLPNDYTTYYYRILSYYGDNYNADCDGLSVSATSTKTVKEVTDFQYATSGYIWNYLNGGSMLQCLVGISGFTNQIGLSDYGYPYTNNTRQLIISNPIRDLIGGATTGWTMKIKIYVNATLSYFVDYDKIGIGNTANSNGIFSIETVLADGKQGGILATRGDKTIEYRITSELNFNDRLIFQLNSASQGVSFYKIWFEKENT